MNKTEFKYWEQGHILVGECFLRNECLNPMINWLNLHRDEILNGDTCEWEDKTNDVVYTSVKGWLSIVTNRDMVLMGREDVEKFVAWLNEHRDVLNIRGMWVE